MRKPTNGQVTFPYGATTPPYSPSNPHAIAVALILWYDYVMEIFKDVCGYEGFYQISSLGRLKRVVGSRKPITKGSLTQKGYLSYKLYKDNVKKTRVSHRLVAKAFIPNPQNLPQVNHKDGDKLNNTVDNLEWCTNYQNMSHAIKNGLVDCRGEKSGKNKYPESIIRLAHETKLILTDKEFAQKYSLRPKYVNAVRRGERWNWLWREYA